MKDIKTIQLSCIEAVIADVPAPIEERGYGAKYVRFGKDNMYPDFLLQCYDECATLQSIINGIADYIAGAGMTDQDKENLVVNTAGDTLLTLAKKATLDYLIFGAFAINVLRNRRHEVSELYYLDVRKVRLNEDGDTAYVRNRWSTGGKMLTYPVFRAVDLTQNSSVFYFKVPRSRGTYGLPMWSAATKDVRTSIEISTYHLSSILNNFAPSAIVNFNNGVPTQEVKEEIERKLNKKFSGASNAARLLVSFNDSKDNAVTLERMTEDNFDKKYEALSKSVRENIFIAFRAHPQLFGADPERQGFNSVEYEQTFKLFKETVVSPLQSEIEKAFAAIGGRYAFQFKEFTIDFATGGAEE